jgi:hypothetical protein
MRVKQLLGVILAITLFSAVCSAGDFSFAGNFTNVNQVQYFTFTVTSGSTVVIQSYSYGGGTNSVGARILRGGFDPSITLFFGTGPSAPLFKTGDDEFGCQQGTRDTLSKVCYDVYWQRTSQSADLNSDLMAFEPGTYTPWRSRITETSPGRRSAMPSAAREAASIATAIGGRSPPAPSPIACAPAVMATGRSISREPPALKLDN